MKNKTTQLPEYKPGICGECGLPLAVCSLIMPAARYHAGDDPKKRIDLYNEYKNAVIQAFHSQEQELRAELLVALNEKSVDQVRAEQRKKLDDITSIIKE